MFLKVFPYKIQALRVGDDLSWWGCSYNLGGQLEKVHGYKSYGHDYVSKIGYDKFEQRTYLKYCNGAETFYTYDPQRGKAGGQMAHTNTYSNSS